MSKLNSQADKAGMGQASGTASVHDEDYQNELFDAYSYIFRRAIHGVKLLHIEERMGCSSYFY